MARNRDPFTQALASLRERIHSGALAGGAPVIVQDEAARLQLSTTPIREALARLSGEGLVERAASGGYVTVRLDAAAARDRYAMHGEYVKIALHLNARAMGARRPPAIRAPEDTAASAVNRLFGTIVCSAGNHVLWRAFERVGGQLELVRRFEPLLFEDLEDEADILHAAYSDTALSGLVEVVARYHERRELACGPLAALVFGPVRGAAAPIADDRPGPSSPH